jgi:excisionase family DNA binding protein
MKRNLLTTKEAARYLRVSASFLERNRWAGARIPFIKLGSRAVRYEHATLDAYIASKERRSTGDAVTGAAHE